MKRLSIVIPVFNEEKHIRQVFERIKSVEFPCPVEYVVIDDCSKDNSWAEIQKIGEHHGNVIVQRQEINKGKGAALHKGFELATGDIIAIQDADFEYEPSDLRKLVQPIIEDRADVVYGSRFHKNKLQVHRTFHYLVNRILTLLSNVLSGIYLSDMETCYKVFRSEIIKNIYLECQRFGFEPEVTASIAKLNLRVEEHPISYNPRNYDEGKKIGWRDGFAAIWFIWKYNRQPLHRKTRDRIPQNFIPQSKQWL